MAARKDDVLLQFLDRLYREILAMENARNIYMTAGDLRPPIEYYHDAVRAWAGNREPERLTVERLAGDLRNLRARSDWLASGPQAFWPHDRAQATALKQRLVLDSAKLVLPMEAIKEDLSHFARRVMRDTSGERLQQELDLREAQKFVKKLIGKGRWEPLTAQEFWESFAYVVEHYLTGEDLLLPDEVRKLESHFRGGGKDTTPPKAMRPDYYRQAEEGLKALWVQMMPPVSLMQAFSPAATEGAPPEFDPVHYLSEEEWQKATGEAARLAEAYARYTLLFAAALVETVNTNYMELLEGLDQLVEAAAELKHAVADRSAGQDLSMAQLEQLLAEIQNRELHENIEVFLHKQMQERNRRNTEQMHEHLNSVMRNADERIKNLESSHFSFLSTQLAVYEESKDLVKKLAGQGLNIAGRFVGQATAQGTQRGKGEKGRS
ncbi:MAG: hypothetical protein IT567_03880 [Alphaproteobacteria bacterium]|nr:hypothetical protein [Alphaproteobacteria bacterium]